MRDRVIAGLALAIPVLAVLGYLFVFDAPRSYLAVNVGALFIGALWTISPRSVQAASQFRFSS